MVKHEVESMKDIYLFFLCMGDNDWARCLQSLTCDEHNKQISVDISGKLHEDGSGDLDPTVIVKGCCQKFIDRAIEDLRAIPHLK